MDENTIIVIGAGPAGLMAAGQAAMCGAATMVLEKKSRPGRKLRLSGKGRCNITNRAPLSQFIAPFNSGGDFLRQAFARFFAPDLISFFHDLHLSTVTEPDGRVFPADNDARRVVDTLEGWVARAGARLITSVRVESLTIENHRITGVECRIDSPKNQPGHHRFYPAAAVIIATGGKSYPATGSTGDGYRLAESAGHTIIPPTPALVPIITAGDIPRRLQGLSLNNAGVRLIIDRKKQPARTGEILFTHYGLSGPLILSLSRKIVMALRDKQKIELVIDLFPDQDQNKLETSLLDLITRHGRQKISGLLKTFLPPKIIPLACEINGLALDKPGHQLTATERRRLVVWLKGISLEVVDHRDFNEAIITAGGIDTAQIDPRTMQSRLVSGLYFAGEVMDIDADTGGFNLQAAFSTGFVAGFSAARDVLHS
nr:NAD(P)/FAD-dependent oxidoreductase [candidate division Zixibacteria bacterium]